MRQLLCPRLVGRDNEMAQVSATIDAALAGHGQTLCVLGEAGVGKSRLSQAAEAVASARGLRTLRGRCVESGAGSATPSASALRPIAEALLSALRSDDAAGSDSPWNRPELRPYRRILSRLVPEWRERDEPTPSAADDFLVLIAESVLRLLRALASTRPHGGCLLTLEDIHWADAETLAVIEYLVANTADEAIVILVTSRLAPRSAAQALVWSLASRRLGLVLELQRLSTEAVREMASACLGGAAVPDTIEPLLTASAEGLPLLIEDLLAEWANAGALVEEQGSWRLDQVPGPLVPLSFSETVWRRLRQLGEDATRVLRLAALLGRRFDWTLLPAAVGMTEDRVLELLRASVDAQLLLARSNVFLFRHALTRDAVLAELLPAERARRAARLLELLEATQRPREAEWCELAAELAEIAGDGLKAASFLLASGEQLLGRGALTSAEAMLDRARSLLPAHAQVDLRARVEHALLRVLVDAGNYERAADVGRTLLGTLARSGVACVQPAEVHLAVATSADAAADYAEATRQLEAARTVDCEGAFTARLDALAARIAIDQRRPADADRLARAALHAAESRAEIDVACEALVVIGRLARTTDLDAAETAFERARQLAEQHQYAIWHCRALHELGTIDMFRNAAPDRLLEARALALEAGALETAAWVDGELAALFNTRFEMQRSLEYARSALEAGRRYRLRGVEGMALLFEAEVYAYRVDRAAMERSLAELARVSEDGFFTVGAWECRGIASLLEEDRPGAVRDFEQAVDLERSLPVASPSPTLALWALNRTLDDSEDACAREALRDSSSIVNFCNAGHLAYADAIALGHQSKAAEAEAEFHRGDELLVPAPWFHQYGRRLVAEAAVRDGWGAPSAWLADAEAFFTENDYAAVATACRSLLRRSGATLRRPAARRGVPEPFRGRGVTQRELEVLARLTDGLSNKEIGSRLYLSPKTVEKHVASLMDKLDVRTRAGLATLAALNLGDAASQNWGKSSM